MNEKIAEEEDRLLEIPKEIKDANDRLMILSMDYFYSKIRVNHTEAQEIEEWIAQVRIDLKKNIILIIYLRIKKAIMKRIWNK